MSRPILFSSLKASKLPAGTELIPAYPTGGICHVVSVSKNKREMEVRYRNGGKKTWKVSHICKYYVVKSSDEHQQLNAKGVSSFIKQKRNKLQRS